MRSLVSILSLSLALPLLVSCDSSSDNVNEGPNQTAQIELYEQFEDYAGQFSADASKGVFTSLRDDTLAHAFLYDSQATPAVIRFDDRLALVPSEGRESFSSISDAGTWVGMSRVTLVDGVSNLIVGHFTGSSRAQITLDAGHSISELVFAKGDDSYLAYVDRSASDKILKVVKLSGDATSLTLEVVGSYPAEEKPKLLLINGALQLLSQTVGKGEQSVNVRSLALNASTWTDVSIGAVKLGLLDLEAPRTLTTAGLFVAKKAPVIRTRKALGTSPTLATANAVLLNVQSDLIQTDIFQSALAYDFTSANYRNDEPLALGQLSGSVDGQFLLGSSPDFVSCVNGDRQYPVQKLIRRSDMKVATFLIGRVATGTEWTDVITQTCSLVDGTSPDGLTRLVDASIVRSELLNVTNDTFTILLNSFVYGDQELRIVKFKMNWDTGVATDVAFSEVSSNQNKQ